MKNTSETKPSPLTRLERELLSALKTINAARTMPQRWEAGEQVLDAIAKAEKQDADFDAYIASAKDVNDANHYAHIDGMHQTPEPACPACQRKVIQEIKTDYKGPTPTTLGRDYKKIETPKDTPTGFKIPPPPSTPRVGDPPPSKEWYARVREILLGGRYEPPGERPPSSGDIDDTLHGRTL